jgi:putative heme-binding domain-containing protein
MAPRILLLVCFASFFSASHCIPAESALTDSQRVGIAVEALSRLKGADLESNPALKNAVAKVLAATRGMPEFVEIVRDFHVQGQNSGLLEVAVNHPSEEAGVEAMRLVLGGKDTALIAEALHATNSTRAVHAAEALGNTHDQRIVAILLPLIGADKTDFGARRQAVRSLSQIQAGASALLHLAEQNQLPEDLKFTAATELNQVRWPELKSRAAQVLPPPVAANTEPLPPIAELLKRTGNPSKGAEVFARQQVGCAACHRVNGVGADVGPGLSDIGTKLGKDALYESILDPSAGIAFGYETWDIALKSGDEAFGLIVSETTDEVTVKDAKAVITRVKKSDIASRRQLKMSLMPSGLQQTMSTQDLIDLVEYLSSLKKVEATK